MDFIGVIGKNKIPKNIINKHMNIIKINSQNVNSIKNVKFKLIVVNNDLAMFLQNSKELKTIINNAEYIIINSDLNFKIDILNDIEARIITCGLNQKSTVTFSSINEEKILIDIQREIETFNNNVIETGEKLVSVDTTNFKDIHDILINHTILLLFNNK